MPMPYDRNVDYSLIYALLAIVVICCLTVANRLLIQPAMHKMNGEQALRDLETAFRDVKHPAGTERLSLRTAMAEFGGSEKSCDSYVGEVRRYEGGEAAIRAAYTDQAVKGHPIQLVFLEDGRIPDPAISSLPEPLNDLAGWQLPDGTGQQPLYMVYLIVLDGEGHPSFDCR